MQEIDRCRQKLHPVIFQRYGLVTGLRSQQPSHQILCLVSNRLRRSWAFNERAVLELFQNVLGQREDGSILADICLDEMI